MEGSTSSSLTRHSMPDCGRRCSVCWIRGWPRVRGCTWSHRLPRPWTRAAAGCRIASCGRVRRITRSIAAPKPAPGGDDAVTLGVIPSGRIVDGFSDMSVARHRIAVCPATFDPITNGHIDLIHRAAPLFERIVVGIAESPGKGPTLDLDLRLKLARIALEGHANVEVQAFDCLLADFVRQVGGGILLRGLRAVSDFEYEFQMASMNRHLIPEVE